MSKRVGENNHHPSLISIGASASNSRCRVMPRCRHTHSQTRSGTQVKTTADSTKAVDKVKIASGLVIVDVTRGRKKLSKLLADRKRIEVTVTATVYEDGNDDGVSMHGVLHLSKGNWRSVS